MKREKQSKDTPKNVCMLKNHKKKITYTKRKRMNEMKNFKNVRIGREKKANNDNKMYC